MIAAAQPCRHTPPAAVLAAFWLGCVGPPRVSMMPPITSSSRTDPVQPLEQSIAMPERDTAANLVNEYSSDAGQLMIASILVRLFAGATAPLMSGVFGAFDEDRLFGRPVQIAPARTKPEETRPEATRPEATTGRRDGCAAFLCGPDLPGPK